MTLPYEERKRLADTVIAAVDDVTDDALRILSTALVLARGPLEEFGLAVGSIVDARELGIEPFFPRLLISGLLIDLAGDEDTLERLAEAEGEPWTTLHAAAVEATAA